jgi:diaminopimelate decarboxylase
VRYHNEQPPSPQQYLRPLMARLTNTRKEILVEPGRAIAANAGILLTEVQYLKQAEDRRFAIVDAAMNDLIRPALYSAWQEIIPVMPRPQTGTFYDVVGPVCETGDFLGKRRELAIEQGDLLAVRSAGAYGFTMSSNYNSRPRAAEIMVDGARAHLIRRRETVEGLYALENIPDF